MKSKKPKSLLLIIIVFLIVSLTTGTTVFNSSNLSGEWFSSFFLGAVFGWAICAPIIRISYGEVPFLKIFAVLPVYGLPLLWLIKALPSKSLLFIPVILVHAILSLSYIVWLNGMEFFALFKRSNWSGLFNKSNQDDK
jgi:hypothetical protein